MKQKNNRFKFTLKEGLRDKLVLDSKIPDYPSISAYLNALIETGLPKMVSIENKIDRFEEKLDSMNSFLDALDQVHRRLYITYRIAAYLLARSFLSELGAPVSEEEMVKANSFIESEVEKMKKKFEDKE